MVAIRALPASYQPGKVAPLTWMQRTAQDWLVLTELTHHNATAVGIVMLLQFGAQRLPLQMHWTQQSRQGVRVLPLTEMVF